MTKELEALDKLAKQIELDEDTDFWEIRNAHKIVEQALQRLEAIDNAKPSEALEYLERIRDILQNDRCIDIEWVFKHEYNTIKQALLKAQEQEKVLEIIFKKTVGIFQLSCCKNVYEYNDLKFNDNEKLTKEEFELLKEAFKI